LASLVKKLDKVVADNQDKQMAALVGFLGDDPEALQEAAAEFGKANEVANACLIVPKDNADGPKSFGVTAETSVAVILYQGKKVKALHVFAEGGLDEKAVAAVIADTDKLLAEEEPEKDEKKDEKKKDEKEKKKDEKEKKKA